jgi:hypothetical protein
MINEKDNTDFIEQVTDLEVFLVNKPRTYLRWTNTEKGRDMTDCYERFDNFYIRYVNTYNPSQVIIKGDKMFNTLEKLYNKAIKHLE